VPRIDILKNTHLSGCWDEDQERRFLWGNSKAYNFKILLLRINKDGCNGVRLLLLRAWLVYSQWAYV
jgi:hypothetical protein